jgi:hypothetical protein
LRRKEWPKRREFEEFEEFEELQEFRRYIEARYGLMGQSDDRG